MSLVRIKHARDLISPTVVVALDAWVDAGSASTNAAKAVASETAPVVVTFESDQLFDYRARRPTLEIIDGRTSGGVSWPTTWHR